MINKENILFGIVGLLAGLIIGFMFANSINQSALNAAGTQIATGTNLPPGHPVTGDPGSQGGAIADVQVAIEKARAEPDNFEAQIKAAELFYQIQRFDGAVEFLEQANKIRPDDYGTLVNLGNAYFDSGKYEEAEKKYSAALEKKPDDLNVRTDLGLTFIFRSNPDYDRAIKEFNATLEKDPKHLQALQNLTVAYTKKGDAENAKKTLARLESANDGTASIAKLKEGIDKIGQN